jgi:Fe-S-cluster-containing dehydrogenase component
MLKYRVVFEGDRCLGCGMSVGRCPTHIWLLSQLLVKDQEGESIGFFYEDMYDRVKTLVEVCSTGAMKIEEIEQ